MEVNFDTYPGEFTCNISWGDCMSITPSELAPYGYYAEPSSFFNSYLPNFRKAYEIAHDADIGGTIWMNGFQYLHMHGSNLNCKFLCFPTTVNHISIANCWKFNGYVNFQRTEWYNVHYNNYTNKSSINEFDVPLVIKGVTDFSNAFSNCANFNKPIPDFDNCYYANDCSNMFYNSVKFNSTINMPASVTVANYMFHRATRFNADIEFKRSGALINCVGMFQNCFNLREEHLLTNTDGSIMVKTLPERIIDSSYMFNRCYNLRTLPELLFEQGSRTFRSYVVANYMFSWCNQMNFDTIVIPNNSIEDAEGMFIDCRTLNPANEINIGRNVINTPRMFQNCYKFNTNVNFGFDINDASNMFNACNALNVPLPNFEYQFNYLYNAAHMYAWCTKLDQYINIENRIFDASYMFSSCNVFTQNITLLNACQNASHMFYNCNYLNMPFITITQNTAKTNCKYMFGNARSINVDNFMIDDSCFTYYANGNLEATCLFYNSNLFINNLYITGNSLGTVSGLMNGGSTSSYSPKDMEIKNFVIHPNEKSMLQPVGSCLLIGHQFGRQAAHQANIDNLDVYGNWYSSAFYGQTSKSHLHINHINADIIHGEEMFRACSNLNAISANIQVEEAENMFRSVGYSNVNVSAINATSIFEFAVGCNVDFSAERAHLSFARTNNCIVRGIHDVYFEDLSDAFHYANNFDIDGRTSDLNIVTKNASCILSDSDYSGGIIRIPRSDTDIYAIASGCTGSVTLYTRSHKCSRVTQTGTAYGIFPRGIIYVPDESVSYGIATKYPFGYAGGKAVNGSGYWIVKDNNGAIVTNEYKLNWPTNAQEQPSTGSITFDNRLWTFNNGIVNVNESAF